ncbi:H-NS histone family protein [Candidatus Accumulibacter sp. ACC012]|jgi:DNA-binding protein H-NS|uniref:H-NS histone family protein n=1 Tax=Candidatus Accumulibacter sp. ACC012 TaxID=2823332 RepID=UPI0025C466CD|nr:H-NS histone family protein [Candidatus Accumulibacter sp. ACC012]
MPNYQELLAQRDELNKRIDEARRTEVADAIRRVKGIIQEYDLTAAQCGFSAGAAGSKKARTPVKPKYITPDKTVTWSGRGKLPNVFKALIEAGHRMEHFLLK